jgi:hypothetical protein
MARPRCFIICPIGRTGTPTRQRSDAVFNGLIEPIGKARGYELVRADLIAEPGDISLQVIQHLADDHLVIADLTGANANVFYELALRHAVRRPCVCIFEEGGDIPFDISAYRALPIVSTSLAALREKRATLGAMLDASLEERFPQSPIAAGLRQWRFGVSDRSVPRELVDSLILSYLHLSFTMGWRKNLPDDRRCEEARAILTRLESQLHFLTDSLRMAPPNTFRELEKRRWKVGRGEP